jgi:hypothetical protein
MFAPAHDGSGNGYNLYESYLALKRVERDRPVAYPSGGEWNDDAVTSGDSRPAVVVETRHLRDTTWMEGRRARRGRIYSIVNNREVAPLHDLVIDWNDGRKHGSVVLDGVLPVGASREFVVATDRGASVTLRVYRPAEPFDPPAIADKRGLIELK